LSVKQKGSRSIITKVMLDREPLDSEYLSGRPLERLFNCWIYFITFTHFAIVRRGGQKPIYELVVPIFGYLWFKCELEVALKLTSSSVSVMIQKCIIAETAQSLVNGTHFMPPIH